jgi:6-phosphofructokinase 1
MAGKTDILVGYWHGIFTYVPLDALQGLKKRLEPDQQLWMAALSSTRQPVEWW